jgi:hypothetical protein
MPFRRCYALFITTYYRNAIMQIFINITPHYFSNISAISWLPVLVVDEAGVSEENHRP